MKNQYFADINDYRKYGLLRILAGEASLKIAVCWMLTEDDERTDGNAVDYLDRPASWRHFDPVLFDALKACMASPENRSVRWAEEMQLIPKATYFPSLLMDGTADRQQFFRQFFQRAADCDLVFFDPDNGIEVKSHAYGGKNSSKYIYWDELSETFAKGYSILVYQHFKRIKRDIFIEQLAAQFRNRLGIPEIISLSTPHVLFLLIPQGRHQLYLRNKCAEITARWEAQVKARYHV